MSKMRADPMIRRYGRIYVFKFYRTLLEQAKDAVKRYHDAGYYAFKIKSPGNGWAIYAGGKK